jgi:hypothetical protein
MRSRLTLFTGTSAALREAAIAARLDAAIPTALILEGLASGTDVLESRAAAAGFPLIRVAPACMCCTGNLTLRVHLNRLLRQIPERLYISLASDEHLAQIRAFLGAPPYDTWLTLDETVHATDELAS